MTMPKITFTPLNLSATARDDETLLDAARRAGAPLGNACGARGICARCRVRIVEGADGITPPTAIETRIAARHQFAADERLACQAVAKGDCMITADYWGS